MEQGNEKNYFLLRANCIFAFCKIGSTRRDVELGKYQYWIAASLEYKDYA